MKKTTTNSPIAASAPPRQRFEKEAPDICCICLDEVSTDVTKLMRYTCCGKTCCLGCHKNVMKSTMPDDLKYRCHQCRKPNPETDKEQIEQLREWVDKGEAWAQHMMAGWYRDGKYGLKQSYAMAAMLFEKAVAQGEPTAMYNLALMYRDGHGVAQSFEKAAELYAMAVEQGLAGAIYNLGIMYQHGRGVAQSFEKSAELFTMAAEQGDLKAMFNLGCMYRDGEGVVQSFKKAAELYTMAAEQGAVDAMFNLGLMYFRGDGVGQSNELAREWWTKAANEGDEGAIENLKSLDLDEHKHRRLVQEETAANNATKNAKKEASTTTPPSPPPPQQSKKEAVCDNDKKEPTTKPPLSSTSPPPRPHQMEKLDDCCVCLDELSHDIEKNGRALCCGKQWHMHCHNNAQKSKMSPELKNRCHHCRTPFPTTDKETLEQLREWVDKDKAWAQHTMAGLYRDGKCGLKQAYVMAAMLFEKAVKQGDPSAMYELALLYAEGRGVAQSFEKTAELYAMAAEQGYARAMFNLGLLYEHGQGVAQSFETAAEFYTMAAEQGNDDAMCNLGMLYIQGQGVDESLEVARKWFTKAAKEENEQAVANLQILDEIDGKSTTTAPTTTAALPPSVCCSSCNTPQPSTRKFQRCRGCRTVQYCDKECQRAHWSPGGHKQECKRLRKKKEAKKEAKKKGSSSSQNKQSK
jgi:TPR repeat protein